MKIKTINISVPEPLLNALDKQAEMELRNRSELIRESIRSYLHKQGATNITRSFIEEEIKRITHILNFSKLKDQATINLSCVFRPQPNNIPDLFAGDSAQITQLIEKPPHFRYSGWDLQTLDKAKPVAGEYLQVANGDRKVIRIYRDGQIVFAGDENFFGHGVNKEQGAPYSFNGMAVAELITNFVNFSGEISKYLLSKPVSMIFKIRLLNPRKENIKLTLVRKNFPFPDEIGEVNLDFADREIFTILDENYKFEKTAYMLLAEFFYFFGLREDQFWYVNKNNKEVDLSIFNGK